MVVCGIPIRVDGFIYRSCTTVCIGTKAQAGAGCTWTSDVAVRITLHEHARAEFNHLRLRNYIQNFQSMWAKVVSFAISRKNKMAEIVHSILTPDHRNHDYLSNHNTKVYHAILNSKSYFLFFPLSRLRSNDHNESQIIDFFAGIVPDGV